MSVIVRPAGVAAGLMMGQIVKGELLVSFQSTNGDVNSCVERGVWTAVPKSPPTKLDQFTLKLKDVDAGADDRIRTDGAMTFHVVGCSGDFSNHLPQALVASAMAAQVRDPGPMGGHGLPARPASFFYHLGDVVYKPDGNDDEKDGGNEDTDSTDQQQMYSCQFYCPNTGYGRFIFAIAGNHDGKLSKQPDKSAIDHFLLNFCATDKGKSPDNKVDNRAAMVQPYVYWRLSTPFAYIIGLYGNIANGGMLDDPANKSNRPQYDWLVAQLADIKQRNARNTPPKAIVLAVHYPPYSGASNFAQRGDPTLGPTSGALNACPLGYWLQQAFVESGQRPDAIFSAHAHLYQRLTFCDADGWELPYLIAGSGGHSPVENMWTACDGTMGQPQSVPFDAILPKGSNLAPGQSVRVAAYNDQAFGFLRVTIAARKLAGEFFTVEAQGLTLSDAFVLDMDTHRVSA